jgi:hypothetical protein
VSAQASLIARPFYYTYIDADPANPDTVYVNNLSFWKSTDGGVTWTSIPTPHGDNHGMWINPDHPEIFIQSNDGGANVTVDGGRTWSTQHNQPTAEIYQVAVDDQVPYRLYGAQQDNTTVIVPSLPPTALGVDDPIQYWTQGPGCETGPIAPRIDDPSIVYGSCKGEFTRMNMKVGQEQQRWVDPQNRYGHAARDLKYRFQRVSPMELSPHDPRVIYYGSQYVHRTRDEGLTWETISPDLTAREPGTQGISGEPITRDITGEEMYSTLYAIRESPLEAGVIWTGSNDGPVHVSRDAGRTWTNVTPKDLPPGGRVQNIEVPAHKRGSALIAVYRYLLDDWQPYIYRTDDYGATWRRLTDGHNGIPADCPTRVVREDPAREGLLYAGTEFGLFVSFDNGAHWQSLQQNLPVTPVTDIRVHRADLVLSTMGRSFWILDNVTPLRQIAAVFARGPAAVTPAAGQWVSGLLDLRDAWRLRYAPSAMTGRPEYPAPGAIIDYFIGGPVAGPLTIEILDAKEALVRNYTSAPPNAQGQESPGATEEEAPPRGRSAGATLDTTPGVHRIRWDLRLGTGADKRAGGGPMALPGKYFVRFHAGEVSETKSLELRLDPRVVADGVTQADLEEQLDLLLRVQATMEEARALAAQLAGEIARASHPGEADARVDRLRALRARLVTASGPYPQPMLIDQLASIARMAGSADQRVGRGAFAYLEELRNDLAGIRKEAKSLFTKA